MESIGKGLSRATKGAFVLGLMASLGCFGLSRQEASETLDEASVAAQANALVSGSVEIYTSFTIGGAVEQAASELRTFVETQFPCADVTLDGATLTVVYGAKPGNCTYRGQTYHGTHVVSVMTNASNDVVVHHTWQDLRNELVQANGSAVVTWSLANQTRQVSHDITWKRLSDGRTGTGTGERTQRPLPGGLSVGFVDAGELTWVGNFGTWNLTIDDVEMRWVDPCPYAGGYELDTPFGKRVTLDFVREDSDTITVTIANGADRYDIDVSTPE